MYPFSLLSRITEIFPLFWNRIFETPCRVDYSIREFTMINSLDQDAVMCYNSELLLRNHAEWWMWWYLENRSHILAWTHILDEGRIYHLGIDILFPTGTSLYNPLDWEVYEKGYESGKGNYGGYMIIRYSLEASSFFVLYGHLSEDSFPQKDRLLAWEQFATLGSREENGDWFPHLHMQVFTGRDFEKWKMKGYCTLEDIPHMRSICPDPTFLIRY